MRKRRAAAVVGRVVGYISTDIKWLQSPGYVLQCRGAVYINMLSDICKSLLPACVPVTDPLQTWFISIVKRSGKVHTDRHKYVLIDDAQVLAKTSRKKKKY